MRHYGHSETSIKRLYMRHGPGGTISTPYDKHGNIPDAWYIGPTPGLFLVCQSTKQQNRMRGESEIRASPSSRFTEAELIPSRTPSSSICRPQPWQKLPSTPSTLPIPTIYSRYLRPHLDFDFPSSISQYCTRCTRGNSPGPAYSFFFSFAASASLVLSPLHYS